MNDMKTRVLNIVDTAIDNMRLSNMNNQSKTRDIVDDVLYDLHIKLSREIEDEFDK